MKLVAIQPEQHMPPALALVERSYECANKDVFRASGQVGELEPRACAGKECGFVVLQIADGRLGNEEKPITQKLKLKLVLT